MKYSVRYPTVADAELIHHTGDVTSIDPPRNANDARPLIAVGAALAGLGVLFGAFGAHALKASLSAEALGWWHTAVEYQVWHALAVVAIGLTGAARLRLAAWLFVCGAVIFSGTLYAMALGAPVWLGAVTPLGGIAMICGWIVLAWRSGRA